MTFVWQILGYPGLAGKPPGAPVFGLALFFRNKMEPSTVSRVFAAGRTSKGHCGLRAGCALEPGYVERDNSQG